MVMWFTVSSLCPVPGESLLSLSALGNDQVTTSVKIQIFHIRGYLCLEEET